MFNEKNNLNQENKFLEFKKEILKIREEEIARIRKTADLIDSNFGTFDINDLTYEDMEMFEKIKSGKLNKKDLDEYKKKINKEVTEKRRLNNETKLTSREIFLGFLINLATPLFYEEELKKINKNK
ncbi:MAG: hypothetical protein ACP5QN_01120 [Minisyncoccia bacterium]